jgi:hypothetical protein
MKIVKAVSLTISALAFIVAVGAAASPKDSKRVTLQHDATVAGSHLAGGDYSVQWQTHSPEATISFWQKGKVVATAEGKVVDRGTKPPANEVIYSESANGTHRIQELRFRGSSEVIVFNQ